MRLGLPLPASRCQFRKGGRALYVWDTRSGKLIKLFEGVGDDAPSWLDDAIHCVLTLTTRRTAQYG